MFDAKIFPLILIALFAAAAIRHAFDRDWPQVGYYAGALILNVSILWMGK